MLMLVMLLVVPVLSLPRGQGAAWVGQSERSE